MSIDVFEKVVTVTVGANNNFGGIVAQTFTVTFYDCLYEPLSVPPPPPADTYIELGATVTQTLQINVPEW